METSLGRLDALLDGQIERMQPTEYRSGYGLEPQSHEGPIIWAIDAFHDTQGFDLRIAQTIHSLFPGSPIHPVYVMNEQAFSEQAASSFLRPALKPSAKKALLGLLRPLKFISVYKPRVLVERSSSRAACARKLLRYADRIGASCLILGHHGHRGLSRLLVDQFSEAVLSAAIDRVQLPIYFLGPQVKPLKATPRVIVFPTDFSNASRDALEDVIQVARSFNADLHLFHNLRSHLEPLFQTSVNMFGGGWVSLAPFEKIDVPDEEAREWMDQAHRGGVRASYIYQNSRESTANAIVQYAETLCEPCLLAMVSQTGAVSSAILGSITRDVIQTSASPVYLAVSRLRS